MTLSVIVPVLDEERVLAVSLAAARQPGVLEIIVVDGGSRDGTVAVARRLADSVVTAPRGRARQMNAGAAAAGGDAFLFLHADTRLPDGYPAAVSRALADPGVAAGRFDVRLDARGAAYAAIARGMNLRSRLTGIATGDQAIFLRRETFARIGGYPVLPIMEDIALCRLVRELGRMAVLRDTAITSARRWQRRGVVQTVVLMWTLRFAYFAGVSPARLAQWYADAR
jgi:rSAM/selenodomain-associated transferase 2